MGTDRSWPERSAQEGGAAARRGWFLPAPSHIARQRADCRAVSQISVLRNAQRNFGQCAAGCRVAETGCRCTTSQIQARAFNHRLRGAESGSVSQFVDSEFRYDAVRRPSKSIEPEIWFFQKHVAQSL